MNKEQKEKIESEMRDLNDRNFIIMPAIMINGVEIGYVPDTLIFDEGLGDHDLNINIDDNGLLTRDFNAVLGSELGAVKFKILRTNYNLNLIRQWKSNGSSNTIVLHDPDKITNFNIKFNEAVLYKKCEIHSSPYSDIKIEFSTLPAVQNIEFPKLSEA